MTNKIIVDYTSREIIILRGRDGVKTKSEFSMAMFGREEEGGLVAPEN